MPLALHALRLLLASRCLTSPIRSPPPPSPVCMTTNRIKPSPATGTASRQSKRHSPGSRNRSHHLSCRVGTSSPSEQIAAAAVGLDSGHPDDPRRRKGKPSSLQEHRPPWPCSVWFLHHHLQGAILHLHALSRHRPLPDSYRCPRRTAALPAFPVSIRASWDSTDEATMSTS